MTGPHTAAAEITKITAMMAHDHQSLSPDCAAGAVFVLAFTWRALGMVNLFVGTGWNGRTAPLTP